MCETVSVFRETVSVGWCRGVPGGGSPSESGGWERAGHLSEIMAHMSPTEETPPRREVDPKTGFPFIFRYPTLVSGQTAAVIWLYMTSYSST